jgi:hypothetical protein
MKPLNLDNRPCSPISSNCVVWQGPTLDCINLCTGDTISDVVAKMATELCTLLDQTNVANYDLSCLGITACGPKDFQALIQLLIEKICELNNLPTDSTRTEGACPDCVITVATCLRETDKGLPVTMQLIDYVQVLANKICSLIDQIGDLQEQVNNLDIRVTILENTPPPTFDIPSFTLTSCAVGSLQIGSTPQINVILQEFINNVWCPFYTATGTTSELINAVNAICIEDGDLQLTTGTAFSLNPNWIQSGSYSNVADAVNNIWVALCDMFTYLTNQSTSVNVQDTNTIDLEFSAGVLTANVQDTGWQPLNGFDLYMNANAGTQYAYPQVRRIGNVLHFRGNVVIPLAESTGAVRPWISTTTIDNYEREDCGLVPPTLCPAVTLKSPYSGVGGVILNSFGQIQFYRDNMGNAQSIIPTSVIPTGYALDGAYTHPARFQIANRVIQIGTNTSTMLTTLFSINISATGVLSLGLIKNSEESIINSNNDAWDTSHLNYVISHVRAGEHVPNYQTSSSVISSSPNTGTINTITLPAPLAPDTQYVNNIQLNFPAAYTYPFSCNANDENDLGGFRFNLTGLTAFISPCGTLIPTPKPCP